MARESGEKGRGAFFGSRRRRESSGTEETLAAEAISPDASSPEVITHTPVEVATEPAFEAEVDSAEPETLEETPDEISGETLNETLNEPLNAVTNEQDIKNGDQVSEEIQGVGAESVPDIEPDIEPEREPVPEASTPETEPERFILPRVVSIANQKGGVGKTTTSVNLGACLAELGYRVLVIDLDPQGNATTGLGINARNLESSIYDVLMSDLPLEDCIEATSLKNLFVAPATIDLAGAEIELVPAFSREMKLKRAIDAVKDDFDWIVIDCPPSLGLLTINAFAASDDVIVPIQCEYYALEGLSQLVRNVGLVQSNLNPNLKVRGIVMTMYDARTKLSDQVQQEVRSHFGSTVYRTVIPRTVRLSEAPSFGQPITVFDSLSRGAVAYRELGKEVSHGTSRRSG